MHPRAPWTDVTFAGVYWNCAERLDGLLSYVKPWFPNMVLAVQKSDDNTLEVAQKYADVVIEEPWLRYGDPSFSKVLKATTTKWVFVISDDERPSEDLLDSFQDLVDALRQSNKDGAWILFHSSIDGFDFTREQNGHLRFFKPEIGWPASQHSRPMTDNTLWWQTGYIDHDRSLDEMIQDYLLRWDLAAGKPELKHIQAHNKQMMQAAIVAIAERKGWDYVTAFPWWQKAVETAFAGKDPQPVIVAETLPAPILVGEAGPEKLTVAAKKPRRKRRTKKT